MSDKLTVLMVEDNVAVLDINRELLEGEDCEVYTAATLAEARGVLKSVMPDVAILDITLPDGDGLEFAAELRKLCRASIIFLTAKTAKSDVLAGLAEGAVNYIPKPYDPQILKLVVLNVLNGIRSARKFKTSFFLTKEELEVARLVIRGESNKSIADTLNIAVVSAKKRLGNAYKKLGIEGEDHEKREKLAAALREYL